MSRGQLQPTGTDFFTRGFFNGVSSNSLMKVAFADFLRLRHGNPNAIYSVDPTAVPLATWQQVEQRLASNTIFNGRAEAPFHSLSYPDIRYTLMRPADPLYANNPAALPMSPPLPVTNPSRHFDNGLIPPFIPTYAKLRLPKIPPMRLFQVPDATQAFQYPPSPHPDPSSRQPEQPLAQWRESVASHLYRALRRGPGRPTLVDHGTITPAQNPPTDRPLLLLGGEYVRAARRLAASAHTRCRRQP